MERQSESVVDVNSLCAHVYFFVDRLMLAPWNFQCFGIVLHVTSCTRGHTASAAEGVCTYHQPKTK